MNTDGCIQERNYMKIKPGDSRELSKSSETEAEVSTGTILIDQDYHIIYYNEYAKKFCLPVMMQLRHRSVKHFLWTDVYTSGGTGQRKIVLL